MPHAVATVCIAGCVPPMGVGAGPIQLPSGRRAKLYATGSTGVGAASSREQFQAEGAIHVQARRYFSIGAGMVYNTLRDRDGDEQLVLSGVMPYVRPTFYLRGVSFGAALSGFGFGGGGGGFAWGMIEPRLGYGTERWSVYAAWLRHGATFVGGSSTDVSARHWRVGGDYYFDLGPMRLALAAELTRGDDSIRYTPGEGSDRAGGTFEESYTMAAIKLRVMSHAID